MTTERRRLEGNQLMVVLNTTVISIILGVLLVFLIMTMRDATTRGSERGARLAQECIEQGGAWHYGDCVYSRPGR